jgi:predicted TPR repeat methyltransferase
LIDTSIGLVVGAGEHGVRFRSRDFRSDENASASGEPTNLTDALASRDLLAQRRYAYAQAAAAEGDWRAAADLLVQALERAPNWPPAWFALGEAREKLGDRNGAAEAFRAALAANSADAMGAAARLALLGEGEPAHGLPRAYLARLFDDYAARFDRHLVDELAYRGPALIAAAIDAAAPGRRFARALDLGCGTGLAGAPLQARVERLEGVDLSPAMLAKARERGLYDALEAADFVDHLRRFGAAFDLIVAADALAYCGDLQPVFAAAAAALTLGGLFAFTVETFAGEGYRLGETMRFAHARAHVEAGAAAAALSPVVVEASAARREKGEDAPGLTAVYIR